MDFSLFPKQEEWGSGDEAIDAKLSGALKKAQENLCFSTISSFYFTGLDLKPRAYNPAFHMTIELVAKALLSLLAPGECNHQLLLKLKGDYENKNKRVFDFPFSQAILEELKKKGSYRYQGQIDFYLHKEETVERNPFVRYPLKRAEIDFHTKIILKDFKAYLSGNKEEGLHQDPFFRELRSGQVLFIENFGEFWYHKDQIFSLPLFSL